MKPFSTDGCSIISPLYAIVTLGRRDLPWLEACIEHDIHYWGGGTKCDRLEADIELTRGVIAEGYPIIAMLIFLAVRLGGVPWLPFPWRWGFGHKYPYRYRPRTKEEKGLIGTKLHKLYRTYDYTNS